MSGSAGPDAGGTRSGPAHHLSLNEKDGEPMVANPGPRRRWETLLLRVAAGSAIVGALAEVYSAISGG